MEDNKYYIPTIEEFHKGFEYERILEDSSVQKEVFDFDGINCFHPDSGKVLDYIRVKHLDREDIESCGFEYYEDDFQGIKRRRYKALAIPPNKYDRLYIKQVNKLEFVIGINAIDRWETRFNGTIKNKSELKRVLKMIGV